MTASPLRVDLLRPPTLMLGEQRHLLQPERRTQLALWLALKGGWVPRAEVAALLWAGQPQEVAYRNLRKTLFRLRALPWGGAIEQQPGALRCAAATDLHDFEQALAEGRTADALELSAGELLPGFDDDANEAWSAWLAFARERHRSAWRGAALARLAQELAPAEGIELSGRLLQSDSLDEAAMQQQLRWLVRGGQTARAQQVWASHAKRLHEELGVAPSAELQALHERLAVAPATPAAVRRAPLAPVDDGFVGRSAELRRIESLLVEGDCRLLTLLGPGGAGKTRLARRAAERLAPRFEHGMTWLALEDVTNPDDVGRALAQALGLRRSGAAPLLEQLIAALQPQRLLVLDNVEQLAPHARQLEPLLAACPRLKVIVTSRVRLALAAEQLLPLAGLPCPEPEDAGEVEQFDAARLFIQAARRVEPAFVPAIEAAGIIKICRRVDGLPLALELAAAWARVMPCDAIAAELERGVELLHSADASRPARQASIEAVFEQSWKLLGDAERIALTRLSVFRGGFTAEAARAVAETPWPVLGSLADKSLLRKEGARLAMHPLVHQLARARLDPAAAGTVARAHAQHFLRLLAQLATPVKFGERAALQQLDAEWDNCRAALASALKHGDAVALRDSLVTLRSYGDHRTRWSELLALLADPAAGEAPLPAALAPRMRALQAYLNYRLDRFDAALAIASRVLDDAAADDDSLARLQCLNLLGNCSLRMNRIDDARQHYRRVLAVASRVDARLAAQTLDNLALAEKRLGRTEASLRMSTKALAQFQQLGDVAGAALCTNNIGSLELDIGRYDSSQQHLDEALAIAERHGLAHVRQLALIGLTQLLSKTGRFEQARLHGERALEAALVAGNRGVVSTVRLVLTEVAVRSGRADDARRDMQLGLRDAIALARPPLICFGLMLFGELLALTGERLPARRLLHFLLDQPSTTSAERDEIRARVAPIDRGDPAPPRWAGLPIDELVRRVESETALLHAALIAELRRV